MIEPEAHNYSMRIKHLLTIKQKLPPSWKNLVTCWLTIDIHNYSKEYKFLMENSRTKMLNGKNPYYYYNDIISYIKNHNENIPKLKPVTKIIYQKMIGEGIKQHTITGEIQWKKQIPNINLEKILKNIYK